MVKNKQATLTLFTPPKFSFPKLKSVKLESFSLYSLKPNAYLNIPEGVLCLAGANGIGKSTFLAAVNYALTGAVPHPDRKFKSADEYYQSAIKFTPEFFNGRIRESDRKAATITIEFLAGENTFQLTRGLFDSQTLRSIKISHCVNGSTEVKYDGSEQDPVFNELTYKKFLIDAVGLKSFDQYVFLQHFVFTFDESRHLLFWDKKALEQALSLSFGDNPEDSLLLEKLRRDEERLDSRARNVIWDAKKIQSRIDVLKGIMSSSEVMSDKELEEKYFKLNEEVRSAEKKIEAISIKQKENLEKIGFLSAQILILKNEYSEVFTRVLKNSRNIKSHPLIRESIDTCQCGICGSADNKVVIKIEETLSEDLCPLCNTSLKSNKMDNKSVHELKSADEKMASANTEFSNLIKTQERLKAEKESAESYYLSATKALTEFQEGCDIDFSAIEDKREALKEATEDNIAALQKEKKNLQDDAKKLRLERDKKTKEAAKINDRVAKRYIEAEEIFVPQFRELAESFIGLDIDLSIEKGAKSFNTLLLKVENDTRNIEYELSESQRFFLDIALRMAIASFISESRSPAPLFIDTPEGSLDIAYESQAGFMFATFAKKKHGMIMTANINTSALLLNLAEQCGQKLMTLVRMTTWASLSEVQQKAEALFNSAFDEIEKRLHV